MIPFDPRKPTVTSGVRIGTPAVTTRGMRETEMKVIGELIARVLESPEDIELLAAIRDESADLCRRFPLYPERWDETD
jgi:glycine hydroxymethyltransferase